jgi:photosystem II stability/assembly factor-like uncharacterized protein
MTYSRHLFHLAVVISFFLGGHATAQIGWTNLQTNTTNNLEGIFSASALQTIVVGANGSIIGTTNGGVTWIAAASGTTARLRKVVAAGFTTPVIWAVGDGGTLLHSTTGGYTWAAATSGVTEHLHDIFAIDYINATSFCAVGAAGTIIHTTNSGVSWAQQQSQTSVHLNGVFFTDALFGHIVGDAGTILKTSDGGANWNSVNSGVTEHLNHVFFVSQQHGWIVGDAGIILATTDGGQNWSALTSGSSEDLLRLFFADISTGTAVGRSGTILRTTNAGASWTQQLSGTTQQINSVFFTDVNTGIIVGNGGMAKKTINGGIPVELESFTARLVGNGSVRLEWITASETRNYGFQVERNEGHGWKTRTFVHGHGDSKERHEYSYVDAPPADATLLRYRLRQIDFDGSEQFSPVVDMNVVRPEAPFLSVSPNPAVDHAYLHAAFDSDTEATLVLFDINGRPVARLLDGLVHAGTHSIRWSTAALPRGMYFAVLTTGGIFSHGIPVILR